MPAEPSIGPLRHRLFRLEFGLLALLLLSAMPGCTSKGILARNLPAELHAKRIHSAQHLDLSRFAQGDLKNDFVYPGDTIELSISTGLETRATPSYTLRVDDEGAVNVPLVGLVKVAGLELTKAEELIREASVVRGIYRNPQVALTVERRRSNKITILGAVKREGSYELPSNQSDLVSAIVAAGGLTTESGTIVEIRRPPSSPNIAGRPGTVGLASYAPQGPTEAAMLDKIDLKKAVEVDPRRLNVADGTVVMISRRPKQAVQVMGLVKRPGQFDLEPEQEMRLLDAIARAGGLTTEIANRVIVVRQVEEDGEAVVIDATVRGAKRDHLENIALAPGDVVSVEETPLTFLTEELRKYVRIGITASSSLTPF